MKYYLHDSNSFNDEKITELYLKYGYEGLGLFYTILERLAQQEKPIKTIVLKAQLNIGKKLEKCWSFMEQIDLISSNNGDTFNKQLLNFSEKYKIKKENNAKRILQWRENQSNIKNVTCYESVCNSPKVKLSKVNKSKENKEINIPSLIEFLEYAKLNKPKVDILAVELKYKSWVANEWKNGKDVKIVNWKTALLNTLPYIAETNMITKQPYNHIPS